MNITWWLLISTYWYMFVVFTKVQWIAAGESRSDGIRTTKSIFVWMPMLTMVYEIGIQCMLERCFGKFKNNDAGKTWLILMTFFNPEIMRFLSFILVYLDGSPVDIALNVLSSLVGEIWIHTQVGRLCRNEVSIRLCGTTADSIPNLHKFISSSRSYLGYITPVWFISAVYLDIAVWGFRPGLKQVYEKKWFILGFYLVQEFVAEVICGVMRKSSGYERLSAVGHLKFHVQIFFVVCFHIFNDIVGNLNTLELLLD